MPVYPIILLAAGASVRMGQPKQLLPYAGTSLLRHSAQVALQTTQPVIVVLGAQAVQMKEELHSLPVQVAVNNNWEEGMASSVRCGLQAALQAHAAMQGVLFMLCDQPLVSSALLQTLISEKNKTGKAMAAAAYNNIKGVPALFDKILFDELLQLKGQEGARKILQRYPANIAAVDFPGGATDIDTPADYEALNRNS